MEIIVVVLAVIAYLWWANRPSKQPDSFLEKLGVEHDPDAKRREQSRKTSIAICSAICAVLGSFIGIAGFGGAIAGTVPGAIAGAYIGYKIGHMLYPDKQTTNASVKAIAICPACNKKASVPVGRKLLVKCPGCGRQYEFGP